MAKPKTEYTRGPYFIIYTGISEFDINEEKYDTYEEALECAKEMAQECCMNYTIVQGIVEVQFKTSVKTKRF